MFSVPLIVQSPQLSPLPVGTEHCQSGTYFQRGQHCFIGYLGSACPINGVFISPFSCQCRTSQSDSVNIKNAFFFLSIHYLQAKTTSGTSACRTKKGDRLKLEKATHQFPEHYMVLLLSKFPICTSQNSPAGRKEKVPHADSTA